MCCRPTSKPTIALLTVSGSPVSLLAPKIANLTVVYTDSNYVEVAVDFVSSRRRLQVDNVHVPASEKKRELVASVTPGEPI